MKNILRITAFLAVAALFTPSAFAQEPAPSPAAPPECEQAKTEVYPKWLEARAGDAAKQKSAYEAGKQFLSKCTDENDAYVKAVKKWVTKYEDAVVKFEARENFRKAGEEAARTKSYGPLFAAGKALAAAEPDNVSLMLALSNAGELNAGAGTAYDKNLDADAVNFTRRALQAIESGKGTPEEFKQLNATNKDEAAALLNYRLGLFLRTSSPEEAANNLLKAAQSTAPVKSEPSLYYYLGDAYTFGDYKKLADDYNTRFAGKDETDESRLAQAKLNQAFDRILDAYARAIALNTKTDPASTKFKNDTMAKLTNLYKQRHDGSDAGLNELISGSAARRLPLPTDPVPTPAPMTPAPTPAPSPSPTPKPKSGV